jgi:DNA polymerase-3 subunit beta
MKFTIPQKELVAALTRCAAIAGGRSSTPILEQVLLDPRAGCLHVQATDLEIGYHTVVDGIIWLGVDTFVPGEYLPFTLPAKKLLEIVKAIPVTMVDFTAGDMQTFTISGGTVSYTLAGLDPSEYPATENIQGSFITIPAHTLHQALGPVTYCQSKNTEKANLNGSWFKLEENENDDIFLTTASTDGHRLCLNSIPIPGGDDDEGLDYLPELAKGITIPGKGISEILALDIKSGADEDGNTLAVITMANNSLAVSIGHERLTIRLLATEFPDVNRVIPTGQTERISIKRQSLIDSILRCRIATDKENLRGIDLKVNEERDGIVLSAAIPLLGLEAHDRITAEITESPEPMRFNAEYLLQALNNIGTTNVDILFKGPLTPVMIVPAGSDFPQAVIMPMRGA